jgi:hypothetical protein
MKFRFGLVIGFGIGYYLGAMAGRQRYEQLNRLIRRAKGSEVFETAADKAKAVVDLSVERAKDIVESRTHGNGNGNGNAHTPKADTVDLGGAPAPF